ncbi:MAG: hypothetical protein ACYDHY_19705 [Acidiferrobacterales bacterium]
MIKEHTLGQYEILFLGTTNRKDLVYQGFNILASLAKYEHILFTNTDVLLAKDWDKNIHNCNADWISFRIVECGAIGSDGTMISKNFGMTAKDFRYNEFETFMKQEYKGRPEYEDGFVWYMPSVIKKSKFMELGGFETYPPFPQAAHDITFRNKAVQEGWTFKISNYSWAYHLQRARENNHDKPERI